MTALEILEQASRDVQDVMRKAAEEIKCLYDSAISNYLMITITELTAEELRNRQKELSLIKWSSREANLDKGYSQLACKVCKEVWSRVVKIHTEYKNVTIECSGPDLTIQFYPLRVTRKIELKSSKVCVIPGSTINTLDIDQFLIFCKRPSKSGGEFDVRCSQYHTAVKRSDYELFQDRTPRPRLDFNLMSYRITHYSSGGKNDISFYAECALRRIKNPASCTESWQDELTRSLRTSIISDFLRETDTAELLLLKSKVCG